MSDCSSHRPLKIFRIVASLAVIGLGLYHQSWLGVLGIFTLISAFNGTCPLTITLKRPDLRARDR